MTKQAAKYIKENIPYYGKIKTKSRYSGVKAKSWAILSDYVRMRDFIHYGTCVATGVRFMDWREGQGGHYYSMGGHGVFSGFSDRNVHLQSESSNAWGGQDVGYAFGKELIKRYGKNYLKELQKETQTHAKDDEWFHLRKIEEIYEKFTKLKKDYPKFNYPNYV